MKIIFSLVLTFCTWFVHANELLYYWSGAVTTHSAKINVVTSLPVTQARIIYSTSQDLSSPIFSAYQQITSSTGNAASFALDGLLPSTRYYYALEMDGTTDLSTEDLGSFETFTEGAFSYSFVVGSCNYIPNARVYYHMQQMQPLFYLSTGDLHYADPNSLLPEVHREAYEDKVLGAGYESKFLQDIPIAYMWDDHDFCGNNNNGSNGCGQVAKAVYKEYVPHYPLANPDAPLGIYQSFVVGRVRFILSDLRSERRDGRIMSQVQKNWLFNQMLEAKNQHQVIAWISTVSYSGNQTDNWGGYDTDRKEIGDFLKDNDIQNLFILSGDAHMLAIDNGTHADFSTTQNNPNLYPIFQAAALYNAGSDKGGTYSEGGTFPNAVFTSQFGKVTVTDDGGENICINFKGFRLQNLTDHISELLNFDFCRSLPALSIPVINDASTPWIFPNPGSGLYVLKNATWKNTIDVSVFNIQGQSFYRNKLKANQEQYALDLTALPSGIYFVKVEHEGVSFIQKLVKE